VEIIRRLAGDSALGDAASGFRRAGPWRDDAGVYIRLLRAFVSGRQAGTSWSGPRPIVRTMRSHAHTEGLKRVDVISAGSMRFRDPLAFRRSSAPVRAGLIAAYAAGNITWPTRSGPASPTTRRSIPTLPAIVILSREEPISERATWRLPRAIGSGLCARTIVGDWCEGKYMLRPARHADRPAATKANDRGFRDKLERDPKASSPSRRWRYRPCRPCPSQAWPPRATSMRRFVLSRRNHVTIVPAG